MRTVTYDENENQLLPVKLTDEMLTAALMLCPDIWLSDLQPLYDAIRSAAPDHPATAGDADDAARLDWFFGDTGKPADFIDAYLQGIREHWTPDQWRSAIDAAMRTSKGERK